MKIQSNIENLYRVNQNTTVFHAHDILHSGKRYIIAKMCCIHFKNKNDLYNKMTSTEIEFQILLSRFVTNLTRSQQIEFGEIMHYFDKIYCKNVITPICHFPENYADLRRMYIDGEYSIAKQLPIPDVRMIKGHSTVSILDVVADYLLKQDNLIDNITNYDNIIDNNITTNNMHIFNSIRVKEIINNAMERVKNVDNQLPIIPLFLTLWSDDFDPNKSIKSNRQSVWIKTITIFTIDMNGKKRSSTYPLTLAMKGSQHEVVEEYYMQQVSSLKEGNMIIMYSRSHKQLVNVHAELFCILNDQPERRGNLNLANGNSMIHGRFGVLLDSRQVENGIRSCNKCTKTIIEEAIASNKRKYRSSYILFYYIHNSLFFYFKTGFFINVTICT